MQFVQQGQVARTKTMPKRDKLTKKQALAAQALADPTVKTVTEVARIAGVDRKSVYNFLQNSTFQEAVETMKDGFTKKLKALGLDEDKAAQQMVDGIEAVTTGQFGGDPDHKTRFIYLERFLKLKGIIADRDEKDSTQNTQVNIFNFKDVKTGELLKSINDQLAEFNPDQP